MNRSLDCVPGAIIVADFESLVCAYANDSATEWLGTIAGRRLQAVFPELDCRRLRRRLDRGARFQGTLAGLADSSPDDVVSIHAMRRRTDEADEIVLLLTDESRIARDALIHRKYATMVEASSLETARRLAAFPEQNPNPVLQINSDGEVVYGNPAWCRLIDSATVTDPHHILPNDHATLVSRVLEPKTQVCHGESSSAEVVFRWTYHKVLDGTMVHAYAQDITAQRHEETKRAEATAEVNRSLHEKETLLKEIHHRVKNNLQIISSLLMLQVGQVTSLEGQQLLKESVHRVHSMALIHELLYGVTSIAQIGLLEYAGRLSGSLRNALAPSTRLQVEGEEVEVSVEQAVPVGLILNELLTNAFKYGKPTTPPQRERAWDVKVDIHRVAGGVELSVRDSGPGLPVDFDLARSGSLGLTLVNSLCRQLRATLATSYDDGACFSLTCAVEGGSLPSGTG